MASERASDSPAAIARRLLQQRKVPEALALIQELMESDAECREGQELLGMGLFMARRFDEAKDAFDKLTRMDPKCTTAWVNLGAVQNVLNDHQGATKSLRKAVKLDKNSASAYYNLGIAQKALKMNSMAVSAYREAIRIDPKMAEAYINLGNLYIEMKNLNQAVRLLQDAVSACPNSKKLPVILQKAKDAKEGNRRAESPLGRLVNEEELAKKQIRTAPRQLDDVTRVQERESLHDLGKTIRRSTRPLVALLNDNIQQQLHVMELAAAQKDDRCEAPTKLEEMIQTLNEVDRLRNVTREAIQTIRGHLEKTDPGL